MTASQIITHLQQLENQKSQEQLSYFAIGNGNALGINIPTLRTLAKDYLKLKDRHSIVLELWKSNIHEAMLLATMIADSKLFTAHQMDAWTHDFYSWDICDQACGNLFQKTPFFLEKAFEYSHSKKEFVKRTGFVLMVQYVVHHKKASDDLCKQFLTRIEEEAWDERNFVWKALNWCLRQIGKRNLDLYLLAVVSANNILTQNSNSAKWIANDALRELTQKYEDGKIKPAKKDKG